MQGNLQCTKCGCNSFFWNPVSCAQKGTSGLEISADIPCKGGTSIKAGYKAMPLQDNKSDQVAFRNCLCGHHYNYHKKPEVKCSKCGCTEYNWNPGSAARKVFTNPFGTDDDKGISSNNA